MGHSFVAICVEAVLSLIGGTSVDAVVTRRASMELACPASDVKVSCHGGKVFHLAEQLRCEVQGCGQRVEYRCEAPLRSVGPFELRLAATCR